LAGDDFEEDDPFDELLDDESDEGFDELEESDEPELDASALELDASLLALEPLLELLGDSRLSVR
jgi:hypothetical protein